MKATRLIFIVLGWPLLLAGLVMIGFGVEGRDDPGMLLGVGIGGLGVAGTGLVFLLVARYFKNFMGADGLDDGVPGTALVRSVNDTGVTINNLNAVLRIQGTITVPGQAPYEGEFRIVVGRTQWGAVQPGMTLPVLVERNDPSKIVHDNSRAAVPAGMPAGMMSPGPGGPVGQTMTAADVIARGVATQGVLQAADPTGMTAGQVLTSLPAHEADDPLVRVVLTYTPSGMAEQRNEFLIRVPDGKGHWLQPGETLPVAYLPDDPTTATIDWSRL
ncbi:MAG: hypothetical protein ACLGHQ_03125 [Acidimicrobiia bacterium]